MTEENKDLYLLWPTPLWFDKAPLDVTDTIKEGLLEIIKSPDFPKLEYERSNRGGYQSDIVEIDNEGILIGLGTSKKSFLSMT